MTVALANVERDDDHVKKSVHVLLAHLRTSALVVSVSDSRGPEESALPKNT